MGLLFITLVTIIEASPPWALWNLIISLRGYSLITSLLRTKKGSPDSSISLSLARARGPAVPKGSVSWEQVILMPSLVSNCFKKFSITCQTQGPNKCRAKRNSGATWNKKASAMKRVIFLPLAGNLWPKQLQSLRSLSMLQSDNNNNKGHKKIMVNITVFIKFAKQQNCSCTSIKFLHVFKEMMSFLFILQLEYYVTGLRLDIELFLVHFLNKSWFSRTKQIDLTLFKLQKFIGC